MNYYEHHVFFCCNQRTDGRVCCNARGAQELRDYAKVRGNQAGCLDRCEEGPVIVVYPEAVWYTYVDRDDVDEIIDEHLVNGRIVERLRI